MNQDHPTNRMSEKKLDNAMLTFNSQKGGAAVLGLGRSKRIGEGESQDDKSMTTLSREGESCDREIKVTADERRCSGQGSGPVPAVIHIKQGDRRGWCSPMVRAEQ
jgi:hypothetical protein